SRYLAALPSCPGARRQRARLRNVRATWTPLILAASIPILCTAPATAQAIVTVHVDVPPIHATGPLGPRLSDSDWTTESQPYEAARRAAGSEPALARDQILLREPAAELRETVARCLLEVAKEEFSGQLHDALTSGDVSKRDALRAALAACFGALMPED